MQKTDEHTDTQPETLGNNKSTTITNIASKPSPQVKSVLDKFEDELAKLGIPYFIAGNSGVNLVSSSRTGFRYTNWPASLQAIWEEYQGFGLDPIVQHSRSATKPYFWHEVTGSISKSNHKLLEAAMKHGFHQGYVVPLRDNAGNLTGAVSLGGPTFSFSDDELRSIENLCYDLIRQLSAFLPPLPPIEIDTLTLQEREVLYCAAIGCSIEETGKALRISGSAVKDAQRRARKKLDSKNTTQACVVASRLGLI